MKISDGPSVNSEWAKTHQKKQERSQEKSKSGGENKDKEQAVKLDVEKPATKVTYDKPVHPRDEKAIDRLIAESNQAYQRLRDLVIQLLERQGMSAEHLKEETLPEVAIDDEARADLEAMLGPDGEYGIEKTSDRIVDFAIALSGGDRSKAETLKDAIIQGFNEAERILGELPDISQKTFDRVMEKFEAWVNEAPKTG